MRLLTVLFLIGFSTLLQGQIFPGIFGESLREELQSAFTPSQVLTSSQCKDTLYAVVENEGGVVECLYSGFIGELDENEDPSQFLFNQNINQEHVFPRAFGVNNTPAEFDMHHLFPTRADVNQDRGNLSFGDIEDALTQKWYYLEGTQTSIPNEDIEAYSEYRANVHFEPRESKKGDVARAVFYVHTIYYDLVDQDFFNAQLGQLIQWHFDDPVDEKEAERSARIATYQSGKENPFVLDCTLAFRLYLEASGSNCQDFTSVDKGSNENEAEILILNNGGDSPSLQVFNPGSDALEVWVFDLGGVVRIQTQLLGEGQELNFAGLNPGVYTIVVRQAENGFFQVKKLIKS